MDSMGVRLHHHTTYEVLPTSPQDRRMWYDVVDANALHFSLKSILPRRLKHLVASENSLDDANALH
jgi:hypothetical protein